MSAAFQKKVPKLAVLIVFFVAVLALAAVLFLKAELLGEAFCIKKVVICPKLDRTRSPLDAGGTIYHGLKSVALWLEYVSARDGTPVDVSWYYEDEPVLLETFKLVAGDGARCFYLLKDNGAPLPVGKYRVTVSTPAKLWSDKEFEIVKRK